MSIELNEIKPNNLTGLNKHCIDYRLSILGRETLVKGAVIDNHLAQALDHKLCNNSIVSNRDLLGPYRPSSAYYLIQGGKLYTFWGLVDEDGYAKLHEHLREDPLFKTLDANPNTIRRSGHLSTVCLPEPVGIQKVALIESFFNEETLYPNRPEYFIAITLLNNQILPLSTDGYPAKLIQ